MTGIEAAQEWLRFSNNDLISARHLFEDLHPKQTYVSAWLSHQCAEKALKAFLVAHDIDPPKIHNLNKLIKLCQDTNNDFVEIEIECASLNRYGVATRYPYELEVDDHIASALLERAQKIYGFCAAQINALFDKNNSV